MVVGPPRTGRRTSPQTARRCAGTSWLILLLASAADGTAAGRGRRAVPVSGPWPMRRSRASLGSRVPTCRGWLWRSVALGTPAGGDGRGAAASVSMPGHVPQGWRAGPFGLRLEGGRLRVSQGWRTAEQADRTLPCWYAVVDRGTFHAAACSAIREAVLGTSTLVARRRAERKAILDVAASYGVLKITRGGVPLPAVKREGGL